MNPVAALIADLVRAGVDADLIGRTAAALAEREPVFVPAIGEADDDTGTSEGAGASRRARNRRYYERRKVSEKRLDQTDSDAVKTLSDGIKTGEGDFKTPDSEIKTVLDGFKTPASEFKTVSEVCAESAKDTFPQTPYQKNSPLKEKAPKGAQKKDPPVGADAGLFAAEPDAGLGAEPERAGATAEAASTGKRRSRRHGGDITGLTAEFDDAVWPIYPQKVARKTALKAWASARQRADFDTIIAGLKRYVAKTDDRPWCNLSTWLNQDRWTDRPAARPATSPAASSARSPPWPASRADHLREHQRRAQASFDKRTGQNNGKPDADIIDIDRTDWTVESRT